MRSALFPCLPPLGDFTVIEVAPGDAVAVTVVTPLVYPVPGCGRGYLPAVAAFTLIVAAPIAPVTPLPVAAPDNVTAAPLITQTGSLIFNRKLNGSWCPDNHTGPGLALTVNTGNGAVAVTVVTPLVYPDRVAVAVIVPAVAAFTLIVAVPSARLPRFLLLVPTTKQWLRL